MRKVIKKAGVFALTAILVLTGIALPVKEKAVAETKDYGIRNPRVEKDVLISGNEAVDDSDKLTNPIVKGTVTTWDTISFGSYPQSEYTPKQTPENPISEHEYTDSDGTKMVYKNKKYFKVEPIQWRVLSVDGDDAFLVSEQNLDCQAYSGEEDDEVTWETCALRTWLNDTFMNRAFSNAEKSSIKNTVVINDNNPYYDTEGGNDTNDKIYLLSIDEVRNVNYGFDKKFDKDSLSRMVKNTAYAKECGISTEKEYPGNGMWLLRSPGYGGNNVAHVWYSGMGHEDGLFIGFNDTDAGVRPALHLNLSADVWKKDREIRKVKNYVTTWNTITFGTYAKSRYTPKQLPSNPVEGKTYTDSDGTKMVYKEWITGKWDEEKGEDITETVGGYFKVEPIKWRVLHIDGNEAVILADNNLDGQPYNDEYENVTWEKCTLRNWLNNSFYNHAFTTEEQKAIITTRVTNVANPYYGTEGGEDTNDKIYLLSFDEVQNTAYGFDGEYHLYSPTREAKNTDYTKVCGVKTDTDPNHEGSGSWWLRSPGLYSYRALNVMYGWYSNHGEGTSVNDCNTVRPVLHLNITSSLWKKEGKLVSEDQSENEEKDFPTPTPTAVATPTPTIAATSTPIGLPSQTPLTTATALPTPTEKTPSVVNSGNNSNAIQSSPKIKTIELSQVPLTTVRNVKGRRIYLKWKKVAGAKGYQLQYATSKKFKAKKTKSTTKTKYTVKKLKKKKTYYMRVRAYTLSNGKKVYGKWSAIKKVKVRK